jgi:hypothetical protein
MSFFIELVSALSAPVLLVYKPKILANPSMTMPSTTKPKLIYCFFDKRSFKNIRANTMVRRQWKDVMGAVSTGFIDAAKMKVIVPKVSLVAALQRINSSG